MNKDANQRDVSFFESEHYWHEGCNYTAFEMGDGFLFCNKCGFTGKVEDA